MKITIMRGAPGSGKSTYAKTLNAVVVSADDYFTDASGNYSFDASKLGEAHKECLRLFCHLVNRSTNHIVVDNTNINIEDVAPYVSVGEAFDYDVTIVQIEPLDLEAAAIRNVHNVPVKKVLEMTERMARTRLPKRWKVVTMKV